MNPFIQILNFIMTAWQGIQTQQKQDEYDKAVEKQIAEGTALLTERQVEALRLISEDPQSGQATEILKQLNVNLPKEAKAEVLRIDREAQARRTDFLANYDARTGEYLAQNDRTTAELLAGLKGQGEQELRDTRRVFSEQSAEALGDLSSRGLSGSGAGASIRHGFATRESDELARIRERVAAQRAEYQQSGAQRRVDAYSTVENARANFDSAMSGDIANQRAAALDIAYGFEQDTGTAYADRLSGLADTRRDTWLDTQGDIAYYRGGDTVRNEPPNRQPFNQSAAGFGYQTGRG